MLSKIVGTMWIIVGALWTVKPDWLKNRLARKMNRKMRRIVYVFIMMFGLLLIGSMVKARGILPKIIGIIGIILAIKGILFITSKTSEKMLDWLGERPVKFFRIGAVVILAVGVMLMFI